MVIVHTVVPAEFCLIWSSMYGEYIKSFRYAGVILPKFSKQITLASL